MNRIIVTELADSDLDDIRFDLALDKETVGGCKRWLLILAGP